MAATTFAHCASGAAGPLHQGGEQEPPDLVAPFRQALSRGADGIEARARLSGDGKVVVAERDSYRRSVRRRAVGEVDAAWLARAGVPQLRDLDTMLGGSCQLCLEVADEAAARAALGEAGLARRCGRLWLRSRDREMLLALRPEALGVRLVHDLARRAYGDTLERHLADLAAGALDGLALRAAEWSLGLATLVQRFGLLAYGSEAREERHLRNLVACSVDVIASVEVGRRLSEHPEPP